MKLTRNFYIELEKDPLSRIKYLNNIELERLYKRLNESFHEKGINLISDDSYDKIKEYIDENELFDTSKVGAPIKKTDAVKLPYWMGSMNKLKPENEKELSKWNDRYGGQKIISDKLDGVSGMYMLKENGDEKLYTRGDGSKGRDISHLITRINGLKDLKKKDGGNTLVVRGEMVISRNNFLQLIDTKQLPVDSNPRNTVAGLVNAKTKNVDLLKYIDFITYELIIPDNMLPSEQISYLQENKFKVVNNKEYEEKDINVSKLSEILKSRRKESDYEIDGIIVTSDRKESKNESGNPDYAFAFKLPTNEIEVKVKNVIWELSKDKYLKPVIVIEEVYLSGAKIRKTTGFNAKYILDNMIGKDSIVNITRSGEVIPYIKNIIKRSEKALLPECEYVWSKNKVDIIIVNKDEVSLKMIELKQLQSVVSTLNIEGLRDSTIEKLYNNDIKTIRQLFDDNLVTILRDLLKDGKLPGMGYKQIVKITESINNKKDTLVCIDLMVASNMFGRGISRKTLEMILEIYPELLIKKPSIDDLKKIKGIGEITAKQINNSIDKFNEYVLNNDLLKYCDKPQHYSYEELKKEKKILSNKKILFSGSKDKELIKIIKEEGGNIVNNISKELDYLIMDNPDQETEKKKKAIKNGMIVGENILTSDQFKTKYFS